MPFRLADTDIDAISLGGLETCIQLPGWDLCFDIGRCPATAVHRKRVLLTHAHMDHAGGIAYHASTRDLFGVPPATYYVPRENAADFESLFEAWRRLDKSAIPARIVGVGPGEPFELGPDRYGVPFRAHHRVYCQGYALKSLRRRLKPAYHGLTSREVAGLRHTGVEVSAPVEVVEVAFCGDTTADVLDHEPLVREARLLILECTFVGDDVPPAKAHGKGHVHLDDLVARAHLLTNEHILLTHFSIRYSPAQIRAALDRKLPAELRRRITPLTDLATGPG